MARAQSETGAGRNHRKQPNYQKKKITRGQKAYNARGVRLFAGKYGKSREKQRCGKQLDATKCLIDFKGCQETTPHLQATKGAGKGIEDGVSDEDIFIAVNTIQLKWKYNDMSKRDEFVRYDNAMIDLTAPKCGLYLSIVSMLYDSIKDEVEEI